MTFNEKFMTYVCLQHFILSKLVFKRKDRITEIFLLLDVNCKRTIFLSVCLEGRGVVECTK